MSLTRSLLFEFNPNQLRIGGDTPVEKLKGNLAKIKKRASNEPHDINKEEVIELLDIASPLVHEQAQEVAVNEDELDPLNFNVGGEEILDTINNQLGDDGFDWDLIKKTYGDESADRQELWDWMYDYIEDNIEEAFYFVKDEYEIQLLQEFATEDFLNNGEMYLENIQDVVKESIKIDGHDCIKVWRAIKVDMTSEAPLSLNDGIGIYWSYEEGNVESYNASGAGADDIIVEAFIPIGSVNWEQTVYKALYHLNYETEIEVFENQQVYIKKIYVDGAKSDDIDNKVTFIINTYFKKKADKLGRRRYTFEDQVKKYLEDNNMVSNQYNLTLNNYYKALS